MFRELDLTARRKAILAITKSCEVVCSPYKIVVEDKAGENRFNPYLIYIIFIYNRQLQRKRVMVYYSQ